MGLLKKIYQRNAQAVLLVFRQLAPSGSLLDYRIVHFFNRAFDNYQLTFIKHSPIPPMLRLESLISDYLDRKGISGVSQNDLQALVGYVDRFVQVKQKQKNSKSEGKKQTRLRYPSLAQPERIIPETTEFNAVERARLGVRLKALYKQLGRREEGYSRQNVQWEGLQRLLTESMIKVDMKESRGLYLSIRGNRKYFSFQNFKNWVLKVSDLYYYFGDPAVNYFSLAARLLSVSPPPLQQEISSRDPRSYSSMRESRITKKIQLKRSRVKTLI